MIKFFLAFLDYDLSEVCFRALFTILFRDIISGSEEMEKPGGRWGAGRKERRERGRRGEREPE